MIDVKNRSSYRFGARPYGLMPTAVVSCLLSMEPRLYPIIQKLSSNWYQSVKNWAHSVFSLIERDFSEKYYGLLKISKCYTEGTTIKFCGEKGIRVDRVIQCEVLRTPF